MGGPKAMKSVQIGYFLKKWTPFPGLWYPQIFTPCGSMIPLWNLGIISLNLAPKFFGCDQKRKKSFWGWPNPIVRSSAPNWGRALVEGLKFASLKGLSENIKTPKTFV